MITPTSMKVSFWKSLFNVCKCVKSLVLPRPESEASAVEMMVVVVLQNQGEPP